MIKSLNQHKENPRQRGRKRYEAVRTSCQNSLLKQATFSCAPFDSHSLRSGADFTILNSLNRLHRTENVFSQRRSLSRFEQCDVALLKELVLGLHISSYCHGENYVFNERSLNTEIWTPAFAREICKQKLMRRPFLKNASLRVVLTTSMFLDFHSFRSDAIVTLSNARFYQRIENKHSESHVVNFIQHFGLLQNKACCHDLCEAS